MKKQQGLPFVKYQAAGNDFVIVEASHLLLWLKAHAPSCSTLEEILAHTTWEYFIRALCHRKKGIGADGFLLCVEDLQTESATALPQYTMHYYNCDGSRATFCGNGARSFAHYLFMITGKSSLQFNSDKGVKQAHIVQHESPSLHTEVTLTMGSVEAPQREAESGGWLIDTGVPHLVIPCDDVQRVHVVEQGAYWRHRVWAERGGVNVDFCSLSEQGLTVRTYERGVEDETLSCGTGVVASALVCGASTIYTHGGVFRVEAEHRAEGGWQSVRLCGPVQRVFSGIYNGEYPQVD